MEREEEEKGIISITQSLESGTADVNNVSTCVTNMWRLNHEVCSPVEQSLHLGPLLLINGFVSLNEGQVGLGGDVGGPSVSRFESDQTSFIKSHIKKAAESFA